MNQRIKANKQENMHACKHARKKESGIFSHLETVVKAKTPFYECLSTAACRLVINNKTVLAYHTVSRGRAEK